MKISNLQVTVEDKPILRGVDAEVGSGELVVIMGKNGSGKSTLVNTIAGHPRYLVTGGSVTMNGAEVTDKEVDERSRMGIFLSGQYPVAIPGLRVFSFLWQSFKKQNPTSKVTLPEFKEWMIVEVENLGLERDILNRSLNDGFSGGEKKKMEVVQMVVAKPKLLILDEIDSGLDVDALKKIALRIKKMIEEEKITTLMVTHYQRILNYLRPDKVLIMEEGKIVKQGDYSLATEIENQGYAK